MTRREQIRHAAIEVIAKGGFHETTIHEIAAMAGVAVGTIYNYYHNKEEILGDIFETEYQRRAQLLHILINKEAPVRERFYTFLRSHFDDLRQNPALAKLLLQEYRFPIKKEYEPMMDYASHIPQLIDQLLDSKCESGLLGISAFGAIQALSMRYLLVGDMDMDAAIRVLCDLFCHSC